jgi:hypothetical protein
VTTFTHLRSFFRGQSVAPEERAREQARKKQVIEKLAHAITARRLETPAALFLELNRPIGFLFSQAAFFARPFLSVFIPVKDVEAAADVLDDPRALDQLLDRITELSARERP